MKTVKLEDFQNGTAKALCAVMTEKTVNSISINDITDILNECTISKQLIDSKTVSQYKRGGIIFSQERN